jgi:hypothetical protein
MEIPKYLVDALYKFSQDVLDEQAEFDRIHDEEVEEKKVKEGWLKHLFRAAKTRDG